MNWDRRKSADRRLGTILKCLFPCEFSFPSCILSVSENTFSNILYIFLNICGGIEILATIDSLWSEIKVK